MKSLGRRIILTRRAKNPEPQTRERAVEELGEIGDPRDFDLIASALHDDVVTVRKSAAHALAKMGDHRAVKSLSDVLVDPTMRGSWQTEVILALEALHDPVAVNACVASMSSKDVAVRRAAAAALGNFGATEAAEALVKAFEDGDNGVVREAIRAVTKIGQPAVPTLIRILEQGWGNAKAAAAEALGAIGDPRAVPTLIAALKDKDSYLQIAVAKALSKFDDPRVVGPLAEALEETSIAAFYYGVREEAELGLVRMGKRALKPLIDLLRNPHGKSRPFIAAMLGQISDPHSRDALMDASRDPDPEVRKAVVKSLMTGFPDRGLEVALAALDDPDFYVRNVAADLLTKANWQPDSQANRALYLAAMGRHRQIPELVGAEGVPILLKGLRDANAAVRRNAAIALGRCRDPQLLESLRTAAMDERDTEVQRALVDAIQTHGAAGIESLVFLLEGGDWPMRRLAGMALASLGWKPSNPPQLVHFAVATNDPQSMAAAAEAAPELLAAAKREAAATASQIREPRSSDKVPPLDMRRN